MVGVTGYDYDNDYGLGLWFSVWGLDWASVRISGCSCSGLRLGSTLPIILTLSS